jgi:hypothetical protein
MFGRELDGRERLLATVAVACLLVLAGCSGAGSGGGADGAPATGGAPDGGADGAPADGAAGDGGGDGDGGTAEQRAASRYADGKRIVVREAEMAVRVKDYDARLAELRATAREHGGYLGDRSQTAEGGWAKGTVVVRVPAENFSAARDAIAGFGYLEHEQVDALDFSAEYSDRARRLENLRSDERQLERLLNETDNASRAEDLRAELSAVRDDIRELAATQHDLETRSRLSTIRVTMHEPVAEKPRERHVSSFGLGDAFVAAFAGGMQVVTWLVVFFGYAIPVGFGAFVVGAVGITGVHGWRRVTCWLDDRFGVDPTNVRAGFRAGDDAAWREHGQRTPRGETRPRGSEEQRGDGPESSEGDGSQDSGSENGGGN